MADSDNANWRRPSRSVLGLGLVLLTVIATYVAWAGWVLREQSLSSAQRQLANLGVALAEQTSRSLHAVELMLHETTERMQRMGDMRYARGSAALNTALRERAWLLPQLDGLMVLDRHGTLMVDTQRFPSPLESFANSEFFAAHSRRNTPLVVGDAHCDVPRRCVFTISQRVSGLRERFGRLPSVAVCESGDQDALQRSEWSFVVVGGTRSLVDRQVADIERFIAESVDARVSERTLEFL